MIFLENASKSFKRILISTCLQDDRMSTASCTSFTGRSTQSEMRDRELMATETILHWRNLPLSLTFRTWLKFTRQRKVQRELLNYITNKKTMELLVSTLATWRRELHTKVTARQHWVISLVFIVLVYSLETQKLSVGDQMESLRKLFSKVLFPG